ncbi:MAG TPA: DUF4388 domain-containing protein [Bellilinea sp.]
MALRGNLRDFSFTQVLNLINLARKTGLLTVEGPGEMARIYFRDGKLALALIGREENDLSAILARSRKITANQARVIRERTRTMSDKEVGLLLINAGYLSQKDVFDSLQLYAIEVTRRLFTWVEGIFQFDQTSPVPVGKIAVRIDLENLIMEGSRQLREWEHLQEEIPSLDMALKFTDRPGANLRHLNLNLEEWRVVRYVNPKNSMRQIAQATRMNDLEIRRIAYALLQAGVVEMVRPGGISPVAPPRPIPTVNKEEHKSLVQRLINRIRSL